MKNKTTIRFTNTPKKIKYLAINLGKTYTGSTGWKNNADERNQRKSK